MMFCANCGSQLDGDEKFCAACGQPVIAQMPPQLHWTYCSPFFCKKESLPQKGKFAPFREI